VLGVSRLYEGKELRLSYVTWQEGTYPFVVVELLSPGTEQEDLGQRLRDLNQPPSKWAVYERILRIPYYIVCDRYSDELQAFGLVQNKYQRLTSQGAGIWLNKAELGLGLWEGNYQGVHRRWLRWYDKAGNWIPTHVELAQRQTEQERQRAEQEYQRAERLAAQLKALGINPLE